MKIYVAMSLEGSISAQKVLEFNRIASQFIELLEAHSFEIVNLDTPEVCSTVLDTSRDPRFAEIEKCVKTADYVVCLCTSPSVGFGEVAWRAMQDFGVPGMQLVPEVGIILPELRLHIGHELCSVKWYDLLPEALNHLVKIREKREATVKHIPMLQFC